MGRIFGVFILFLVPIAVSCDARTFDNNGEVVDSTASNLVVLDDLTFPLSSMSAWTNANYGACGSYYVPGRCHNGADIAAAIGTAVYAIADGTVTVRSATQDVGSDCISSGWGLDAYDVSTNPNGTNTCNMGLLIRHYDASGQPFVAVYGHLRLDAGIHVGDTVTAGQQIGVIGRYPPSSSHLHFGIFPSANTPMTGFGKTRCSASQAANSSFPVGCDGNGFVPPATFITSHFPASAPFSHSDHPTVCETEPTPDGSWYYTCSERGTFEEGENAWVLLRLHDVDVNHQFRVKAYRDSVHQWDWTTSTNDVGSGTWQYSHFWPELSNATVGAWRFDLFVIPQGGSELLVDTAHFRVVPEGTLPSEEGGGGFGSIYPGDNYYYDGNGYTCPGPIEGGENTGWVYTCGLPRTTFEQGETVNGLVRIDEIFADFRYSVDVYKDSVYQWNDTTSWNDVGEWGWGWSYLPIVEEDLPAGSWELRISVDEGNGFELLDTLSFVVTPDPTPFQYGGLVTCNGPVSGGSGTGWVYTCENPTESFSASSDAFALVRIDSIMADFRWRTDVYINGTYQWNDTTSWNDVGEWGWGWAYLAPTTSSVWAGNWEYRIYLDTGNGFQYLDTAYFVVN